MLTRADYTAFNSQSQSGNLQKFSRWYYDQDLGCNVQNRFDGKLLAVAQSDVVIAAGCTPNVEDIDYLKLFKHDRYGRLGETVTSIGAMTTGDGDFYEKVSYDQYSRPVQPGMRPISRSGRVVTTCTAQRRSSTHSAIRPH